VPRSEAVTLVQTNHPSSGRSRPAKAAAQASLRDVSKLDRSLFLLALFQPLKRGSRKKLREVTGELKGERIEIVSPHLLGVDDLSLLLGIVSIAGQHSRGALLEPADDPKHLDAIAQLKPEGEAVQERHIRVDTNIHELLHAAGMSIGSSQYDQVEAILKRLRGVYYVREVMDGNVRVRFSGAQEQLLFYEARSDGDLRITLSERLSKALISGPYGWVYLPDYRCVRGEVARLLMCSLSVRSVVGRPTCYARIDDMVGWLYDQEPGSEGAGRASQRLRDRRRAIRKALEEIAAMASWIVATDARGAITITHLRHMNGQLLPRPDKPSQGELLH
jgi:Replication protein C (RepC)